jgi:SAM-dependent methyltransferase
MMAGHKIDIGCGPLKKPGYLGIDRGAYPGVDHVVDIEADPLPFADDTVSHVFSSHCLEHLRDPERFFREIGRVCAEGAEVEIWTPYGFSNGAFIFSHVQFLNEDHYSHMCILFPDAYLAMTKTYWEWESVTYVLLPNTIVELHRAGFSPDFAIRYFKNVALEFGVRLRVKKQQHRPAHPARFFCTERNGPRWPLPSTPPIGERELADVMKAVQSG